MTAYNVISTESDFNNITPFPVSLYTGNTLSTQYYHNYVNDLKANAYPEDEYTVGGYFSDYEYSSNNMQDKIKNMLYNIRDSCTIRHIAHLDEDQPAYYIRKFDSVKYKSKINSLIKSKIYMSRAVEYIINVNKNIDYARSATFEAFMKNYIKYNRNTIAKLLSGHNIRNILYSDKYKGHWLRPICKLAKINATARINRRNKIDALIKKRLKYTYNKFKILEVDEEDELHDDDDFIVGEESLGPVVIRSRKLKNYEDLTRLVDEHIRNDFVPRRSAILLRKLQNIIKYLANLRRPKQFRENIELIDYPTIEQGWEEIINNDQMHIDNAVEVQPEMMEPEQTNQQQQSGPVVLNVLEQDNTTAAIDEKPDEFWINNSTGDALVDSKHASSMEILTKKFEWNSDDPVNKMLFNIKMPIEVVKQNPTHPATMMFNQYAYWYGDIKIRIHINTTPFHVGKLIFSWYYSEEFDANKSHRSNIASAIQLPHVCFNASIGDDVVMEIPYRSYRSMLPTVVRTDVESLGLYMGNLRCHVFNPLLLNANTIVDGYVHVSFINNKFTGIMPRHIQPEMLPLKSLLKTAEGALHTINKTVNMDKPTNPAVPIMFTPQFTDSFATGKNDVSNVHALRLDVLGQTPHPSGSSTRNEETLISNIIHKEGFLRSIMWSADQVRGNVLLRLPVSPELQFYDYYNVNLKSNNKTYSASVLPPVGAIATMNAYNRGSIVYIIEIICSRYHTGALLASFTPLLRDVGIDTAVQSYNTTLDIGNVSRYEFVVPYINERPYNPRFNREKTTTILPKLSPLGEFNLYVLNQLRNVTGTSSDVYINIYMKAGDDFELAVPVPPLYSVDYDHLDNKFDNPTIPNNLPTAVTGLDTWRYFFKDDKLAVWKEGTGFDDLFQMRNFAPFIVYKADYLNNAKLNESPYNCLVWFNNNGELNRLAAQKVNPTYIAMLIVNNDGNKYAYALTFIDEATAISYVNCHRSLVTDTNPFPNSPTLAAWRAFAPSNGQKYYLSVDDGVYVNTVNRTQIDFQYVPVYTAQAGEDVVVDPTIKMLPSAMGGIKLFGEAFTDLKDYCRRYQLYGSTRVNLTTVTSYARVRIPLSIVGLDANNPGLNGRILQITREGMIGYVSSAFRFYRGGLRFKIMFTQTFSSNIQNTDKHIIIYLQHKPDVILSERNIVTKTYSNANDIIPSDVLQSGYAYTAASLDINNSVTVEIPCYIPTNLLMAQKPDFNQLAEVLHYTLGCLDVYIVDNGDSIAQEMKIHYAFADDMDLSCFVGFPPMVPMYSLNKTLEDYIQPEMDDEKPTTSAKARAINSQPEGAITSKAAKVADKAADKVTDILLDRACTKVRSAFSLPIVEDDTISKLLGDIVNKYKDEYKHLIISVVFQIIQCVLNPTTSTLVTAFLSVLTHIGCNSFHYLEKFKRWFSALFPSVSGEMDDDKTEISSMEETKTSIIRSIVDMSISTFGVVTKSLSNIQMPTFSKGLFNEVRLGALTITSIINLFKNAIVVLPAIWSWVGKNLNPMNWLRWMFSDKQDFILRWISDVEYMTDPNNAIEIKSHMKYCYHCELLVIVGRDIMCKIDQFKDKKLNYKYIQDLFNNLQKTYNILSNNSRNVCGIGIEPYCFRLVGSSQTGKSYVTNELILNCLKSINYVGYGNPIYTKPKTKHYDGLNGVEAAMYIDDFLHNITDESVSENLADLLTLKSKALFIPPRANVNDKGVPFNPLIVAATMNKMYPTFDKVVAVNSAWLNRFDTTVKVEFVSNDGARNANDLNEEQLAKMEHVRFHIMEYRNTETICEDHEKAYKTVKVPLIGPIQDVPNNPTFIETDTLNYAQLKFYLAKQFQEHYRRIRLEYTRDLAERNQFSPDVHSDFDVNLERYIEHIRATTKTINARENAILEQSLKFVKTKLCRKCSNQINNCICNAFNINEVGALAESQSETVQPESGEEVSRFFQFTNRNTMYEQHYNLRQEFRQMLDDDKFSFLAIDDKNMIAEYYGDNLARMTWSASFMEFINKPCIHKLIVVKGFCISLTLDKYNDEDGIDKVVLIYDNNDFDYNTANCCKLDTKEYNSRIITLFNIHYPQDLPARYIKHYNNPNSRPLTRYQLKMQDMRNTCIGSLKEHVPKSSWLGRVGSLIFKIFKHLGGIISTLALVWGVTSVATTTYDYAVNRWYSYKRNNNKMMAKIIESHEPTEECKQGKCNICYLSDRCMGEMAYDQKQRVHNSRIVKVNPKNIQSEMSAEMSESLDRKLRRNYFFIIATTEDGLQTMVRCLGIRGNFFLAVDHYFDKFRSLPVTTEFTYRTAQISKNIYLNEIKYTKIKNSALVIGKLPKGIPAFKDIVNLFIPLDAVPNLSRSAFIFETRIPDTQYPIQNLDIIKHRETNVQLHADTLPVPHITDPVNGQSTFIDYYWSYEYCGKGICGSVLITDVNIQSPIIGMHIAGKTNGKAGFAEAIARETIENILDALDTTQIKDIEIEGQMFDDQFIKFDNNIHSTKMALPGNFNFVGVVPPKFAYKPPVKSKLINTICANQITQVTYDVPHLSHNDERFEGSPMFNGCLHHTIPVVDFPQNELDIVMNEIKDLVIAKVKPIRQNVGPLTVEDAICGISTIPHYDAMEFDTSEGFPFSSIRPKGAHDKKWLFDLDINESGYKLNKINDKLINVMAYKDKLRRVGTVPMTIFIDCLKDAKLPKEKCHKTRIFSVSPVDFTIQFRQMFYDFTIAFQEARLDVESAVGINVDSYEWHNMVQKLLANSKSFVCGDYSKFGPRLMSRVVIMFFDIICDWYEYYGDNDNINRRIRTVMAHEIAFAHHLMLNLVYQVICGAPSGCPITTILNNGVNMCYIRMAYMNLVCNKTNLKNKDDLFINTVGGFPNNVAIVFYGDDLIMTVKDEILDLFNAQVLSSYFSKYDITFTNALKSGEQSKSASLYDRETSFLKRNIKRHEWRPVYTAAMDVRAIEETCNWMFSGQDETEGSKTACEAMLLNAHGHGSVYYNGLRDKVVKWWYNRGQKLHIPLWQEVDYRIYEGECSYLVSNVGLY